jgi:hypothetical protein
MWIGLFIIFIISTTGTHYCGDTDIDWLIESFMVALITAAFIYSTKHIRVDINYKKGVFRLVCALTLLSLIISVFSVIFGRQDFSDDDLTFIVIGIPTILWLSYVIPFYVVLPVVYWIRKGFQDTQDIGVTHKNQNIENDELVICANCEKKIESPSKQFKFKDYIVCEICLNKLSEK